MSDVIEESRESPQHVEVVTGPAGRGRDGAAGEGRTGSEERQHRIEPVEPEDHGHALRGGGEAGAEPVRDHSHRHQPGRARAGRGARYRRAAVRDGAEEPPRWARTRCRSITSSRRLRNSAAMRARRAACARWRWRCGTSRARSTTFPCTRCWAASGAIRFAFTRIRRSRRTLPNMDAARKSARRAGLTWMKMDLGINVLDGMPGTVMQPVGHEQMGIAQPAASVYGDRGHR